tara:strand:- start:616 stop:1467 length:852 start_codon:yes stop_codon:yes gene_type:complete
MKKIFAILLLSIVTCFAGNRFVGGKFVSGAMPYVYTAPVALVPLFAYNGTFNGGGQLRDITGHGYDLDVSSGTSETVGGKSYFLTTVDGTIPASKEFSSWTREQLIPLEGTFAIKIRYENAEDPYTGVGAYITDFLQISTEQISTMAFGNNWTYFQAPYAYDSFWYAIPGPGSTYDENYNCAEVGTSEVWYIITWNNNLGLRTAYQNTYHNPLDDINNIEYTPGNYGIADFGQEIWYDGKPMTIVVGHTFNSGAGNLETHNFYFYTNHMDEAAILNFEATHTN